MMVMMADAKTAKILVHSIIFPLTQSKSLGNFGPKATAATATTTRTAKMNRTIMIFVNIPKIQKR
jgi:hypothetical protein